MKKGAEMKWKEVYKINSHDADANGIVRVSHIMKYMQETANLQMWNMKPSYSDLREKEMAFVLSRIRISLYAPLHAHDEIICESWPCESKGVTFNRCYQILKDGIIIAEAVSAWALISTEEKKLYRVTDIELDYGMDEMLELDLPARFKIPAEVRMSLRGEKTVDYSDLDMNMHMNNTNYPDLLCNYIPQSEMMTSRVIGMAVNYTSEAKLGDVLKVYRGESDGSYYFRTQKPDGTTNIEAEIMLEKI